MHRTVYFFVDRRVDAVTAGHQLAARFLEQCVVICSGSRGIRINYAIFALVEGQQNLGGLALGLKHQIRICSISLFRMRSQRTFDIKLQCFVILGGSDLVLLQHPAQHKLLAFHGTVKCRFIKFSDSVKRGVFGRKLGKSCQICGLGRIQLIQIIQSEYPFGGGFDTVHVVPVGTVAERNLI
ncbi:hypothetical protein D3C73_720850 [compost metagenome]